MRESSTAWRAAALDAARLEKRTRSRRLGGVSTRGAQLDVDGGDAEVLEALGDLLRGHHGGVR